MRILQIISHSFLTSSLRTTGSRVSTYGSIHNSRKVFPFTSRSKSSLFSTMSAPEIEILSTATVTPKGGVLHRCKHKSTSTKTDMIFAIFLPSVYPAAAVSLDANAAANFPAIYWLSGLTCTDENFTKKGSLQYMYLRIIDFSLSYSSLTLIRKPVPKPLPRPKKTAFA
jgi:hypothetical protein